MGARQAWVRKVQRAATAGTGTPPNWYFHGYFTAPLRPAWYKWWARLSDSAAGTARIIQEHASYVIALAIALFGDLP